MITLKLNAYKKCEVLELQNLLELALERHSIRSDCDECCSTCWYKHLCADLSETIKYLEGYIEGSEGE